VKTMMNKLCNYMTTGQGKMLCAVVSTVGGLHLMATESQPVLGFFDAPSFGWFSVQHILGGVLTVCGLCCLKICLE